MKKYLVEITFFLEIEAEKDKAKGMFEAGDPQTEEHLQKAIKMLVDLKNDIEQASKAK